MNRPELNIFVEDTVESGLDLGKITKNLQKMTDFFLSKENLVQNSCLKGYDCDRLCFDIVFCNNEEIHRINKEYRNIDRPTESCRSNATAERSPQNVE